MYAHRMMTEKMRAVRVSRFGGPKVLKIETDVPVPVPTDSQVVNFSTPAFYIIRYKMSFTEVLC